MMKHLFFKTIVFLFLFTITSCSESDAPQDQLPPITQTGANTFGAVVNGKVFITKDKTGYTPPGGGTPKGLEVTTGSFLPTYEYFGIDATNYEGIYLYIYIPKEIPEETIYFFKNSPGVRASIEKPSYTHVFSIINNTIYASYEDSGSITFTKVDYSMGIFSGVFNVTLKNKNNENDIIEITDGRFDL